MLRNNCCKPDSKARLFFRSYTVWNQLSGDFGELDSILSTTSLYPLVERVGRQLYSAIGQSIGWDAQEVRIARQHTYDIAYL
jgi:hypothetical protein